VKGASCALTTHGSGGGIKWFRQESEESAGGFDHWQDPLAVAPDFLRAGRLGLVLHRGASTGGAFQGIVFTEATAKAKVLRAVPAQQGALSSPQR